MSKLFSEMTETEAQLQNIFNSLGMHSTRCQPGSTDTATAL